jgi:flagellin
LDIVTTAVTAVGGDVTDATTAAAAMDAIDIAIDTITTERAAYGAVQSRFDSAINNLQVGMENQAAARGRIMDADFAVETAAMTRSQILQQAGNAMVAQANSAPQSVLQLLG